MNHDSLLWNTICYFYNNAYTDFTEPPRLRFPFQSCYNYYYLYNTLLMAHVRDRSLFIPQGDTEEKLGG